MEESQEILLKSLESSGVEIPSLVSSIRDLTPPSLVSICAQSLRLIDATCQIPASLPDSVADRFKICSQLSHGLQDLGYIGDISFDKFLYPSEEDLYKLIRFLVECLSESSKSENNVEENDVIARTGKKEETSSKAADNPLDPSYQKVGAILKNLRLDTETPGHSDNNITNGHDSGSNGPHLVPQKVDEFSFIDICGSSEQDSGVEKVARVEDAEQLIKNSGNPIRYASGNEDTAALRDDKHVSKLEPKSASFQEQSSKMRNEIDKLRSQENVLMKDVSIKILELQNLEAEQEVLKAAIEMAFDEQRPVDFYLEQLSERVNERKRNLAKMELEWDDSRKALEEKKRSLEESLCALHPEALEKLQNLKTVDSETQTILSEIRKRVEEHSKLSADLEKQPKLAPRRSYIQRITEITKNSRKQDADIERILKETRDLQLESNSIEERLHRTYAVVDETVFREAKKDPVARKAYRLLTTIHETFEQISEKILTTDRTRREVAENEAKLAAMASRSLNLDKLQADLDAVRKENEYLEQRRLQDKK